ncbi:thioesterase domain-containing protein, partial [Pseudomonas syringae group genomosp. 7]|uniref:thioesterase domain-containing protein n=1 Tax=Pseudomonas syringae group genomosp. 7 TaxID=251699 RepID=UPI00377009CA
YRLAGWSFAGVLAYEVATQLLGMDEAEAFLGLIDSYVPRLALIRQARHIGVAQGEECPRLFHTEQLSRHFISQDPAE